MSTPGIVKFRYLSMFPNRDPDGRHLEEYKPSHGNIGFLNMEFFLFHFVLLIFFSRDPQCTLTIVPGAFMFLACFSGIAARYMEKCSGTASILVSALKLKGQLQGLKSVYVGEGALDCGLCM